MKVKKILALLVVVTMLFTMVATIAACHTHTYDESKWESDASYHWHPSTCGHDDDVEKLGHTFNSSNKCIDCGYQKVVEPTPPAHECKDKCPECGKCTTDCTEVVCASKCQGHHECKDICPICKKCTTDCDDPVCANKCPANHEDALTYTITFDVGEHGTLANEEDATMTTVYAYLQRLPEVIADDNYMFVGWFTQVEGGDKVDEEYLFEGEVLEITLYAHYQTGYVITLVVGEGTLAEGESAQYMTDSDGKIVGLLPEPTSTRAHWYFDNWYDAQTGGKAIVEATTVFKKDTTIYARYLRDDGVWAGETFKAELFLNSGNTSVTEYWLGDGTTVNLTAGEVLSMYIGGKICPDMWITGKGVDNIETEHANTVTVKTTGEYLIFLKDYSGVGTDWVVEFRTDTEVGQGGSDLIPAGTGKITIKLGSLDDIVIYLVKSNGQGVKESEFSSYSIYTFDAEIFGNWNEADTKGLVKSTISVAGITSVPKGWIFRWSGIQTGNIEGAIKAGGTYLIKLPANNKGEATVTEIK
ncbi:MAG: InlB B-repeat-containing protein [Clostridiales bacterium]|nr:InlB B-repeat-containing protein [Clostridiales bacterium]